MDRIAIVGGARLNGEIQISGAKNSAIKLMVASLLTDEPLRLTNPDSALMIHTSAPGQAGTLVVSRVDMQGKLLWSTDTGLHRFSLKQILPGEDVLAFVGERPPIPDKLSEPLIVLVDTQTGKLTTYTLWR